MGLILILCIIAACTLCGHALAGTAEHRKQLLESILSALRMLRIQLNSMTRLEDALAATQLPLFISVSKKLQFERSAWDAWSKVRHPEHIHKCKASCLTEQDLFALDRLFTHLGICSREEQTDSIQGCIASLEEAHSQAKERSDQVGRLYPSLGFLAGLALSILMI